MRLPEEEKQKIYAALDGRDSAIIMQNISSQDPINNINIQNILSRKYNGDLLRGGKRRRKTMKKRGRKSRKTYRGGYVYSSSKELDKASSVISSSSNTTSSRGSLFNSKSKSRRSSLKKRGVTRKHNK